jgi:uncharacterized protein (DUF1330 family)
MAIHLPQHREHYVHDQVQAGRYMTEEDALAALAEETTTYRDRLPELVRKHEGQFVLIKGQNVEGVFNNRSAALILLCHLSRDTLRYAHEFTQHQLLGRLVA